MPQFYKGDADEIKFYESGKPIMDQLSGERDNFFDDAYACFVLGEILYDSGRTPLANAIPRAIFRESYSTIYDAFIVVGTFEAYLTVFRNIFGDDVVVDFDVPAPGKLTIDITAAGVALFNFTVRTIVDNTYVIDTIVDEVGDNIVFQAIKGFESQAELEKMLFEMVPDGIWTDISLTLGS